MDKAKIIDEIMKEAKVKDDIDWIVTWIEKEIHRSREKIKSEEDVKKFVKEFGGRYGLTNPRQHIPAIIKELKKRKAL